MICAMSQFSLCNCGKTAHVRDFIIACSSLSGSSSRRRNISIHLRQPIARQSHHRPCCAYGSVNLQLPFHKAGIIKENWSKIQILIILRIFPIKPYSALHIYS